MLHRNGVMIDAGVAERSGHHISGVEGPTPQDITALGALIGTVVDISGVAEYSIHLDMPDADNKQQAYPLLVHSRFAKPERYEHLVLNGHILWGIDMSDAIVSAVPAAEIAERAKHPPLRQRYVFPVRWITSLVSSEYYGE